MKCTAEVKATQKDRGFSLAELVVLLSIGAILAAIGIPVLSSSLRSWQLDSDARNISTTLSYAKLSATSQMTHCRLSFDISGNTWSLNKYNRSTSAFELQGATNTLSSGMANSGIGFRSTSASALSGFPASSSTSITFNSRGIPIDASNVPTTNNVVYLSSTQADYAVTVSLAGRVQLWKLKSSQWVSQ